MGSLGTRDCNMASTWVARGVKRKCKYLGRTRTVRIQSEEAYLRDDIPCGYAKCQYCQQEMPPLPANASHYVVPDADAILEFLEIFELPQFTGVIYLASVLKQVMARSKQRYRRLRSLCTDPRRGCLFFDDEHFLYTSEVIPSNPKGTKGFATWYSEHIGRHKPVVVWTGKERDPFSFDDDDDEDEEADLLEQFNRTLALDFEPEEDQEDQAIKVLSTKDYFQSFWTGDGAVMELCNSLLESRVDPVGRTLDGISTLQISSRVDRKSSSIFQEHFSAHMIDEGLVDGTLRVGVFHVSKHDPAEGFVRPSNKNEASQLEILIPGSSLQNRALPGDLVAVHLLSQSEWRAPKQGLRQLTLKSSDPESPRLEDDELREDGRLESIGKSVADIASAVEQTVPTGKVVGILQRKQRDYVACLTEEAESEILQSRSDMLWQLLCFPRDRRIPMVRITTRQGLRLVGQRFVVRITGWESNSKHPEGHLVRVLGPIGDLNTETIAILVENEINISAFNSLALQELPQSSEDGPWTIPEEEFSLRRDLRSGHRTFSVDPPGSKDVDDALSVRHLQNGLLEVGVHIADVSYFVKQGSLLDMEARDRGTTVYMVGRNWPILPRLLSEGLCSLLGGKDRLAVSVIWTVNPDNDFEIVDVWFGRTIINSQHQMSYAQAQGILDGHPFPIGLEIIGGMDEVRQMQTELAVIAKFAEIRRALRKADGAVELSNAELKFDVDEVTNPVNVQAKLELPMNSIVAELMILANAFVAERIYQSFPTSSLLRQHPPPKLDSFTLLLECCAARGFALDASSNKALAASLDSMRESSDPVIEHAFRALVTRAMSEAKYCATDVVSESSSFYHYGLALKFYTHFTSPIRRYADVLVHRMLLEAVEEKSHPAVKRPLSIGVSQTYDLRETVNHLNQRHRASKVAQKECNELYLLMYLQKYAKAEHAVVLRVLPRGLEVFVPKYDLRGPVYLQTKNGDVLLPAEDDGDDKLLPSSTLQRSQGSIKVLDPTSRRPLVEYNLLDPLCVQLKADGSRVHSPTLRIRVLSPNHSAAVACEAERVQLNLSNPGDRPGRREAHQPRLTHAGKHVEKNNAIKAMEAVALAHIPAPLLPESSKKRKASTVSEVAGKLKRSKCEATCVYLNSTGAMELLQQNRRTANAPSNNRVRRNTGLPWLVTFEAFDGEVENEASSAAWLRRGWQQHLDKAARLRARQLRCRVVNVGHFGNSPSEFEARSRKKVQSMYIYLRA